MQTARRTDTNLDDTTPTNPSLAAAEDFRPGR
jgi:hypothetical protein